jgi:hypothetical protein
VDEIATEPGGGGGGGLQSGPPQAATGCDVTQSAARRINTSNSLFMSNLLELGLLAWFQYTKSKPKCKI